MQEERYKELTHACRLTHKGFVSTVVFDSCNNCCLQGMILTLPGNQGSVRQHLATLSNDSTKLCVTSYSCSAGTGLFMCQHDKPHHFHLYTLHKF